MHKPHMYNAIMPRASTVAPGALVTSNVVTLPGLPSDATDGHRLPLLLHSMNSIHLTPQFASAGQPADLLGIELRPHQRTIVQALLDIEHARTLCIENTDMAVSRVTN